MVVDVLLPIVLALIPLVWQQFGAGLTRRSRLRKQIADDSALLTALPADSPARPFLARKIEADAAALLALSGTPASHGPAKEEPAEEEAASEVPDWFDMEHELGERPVDPGGFEPRGDPPTTTPLPTVTTEPAGRPWALLVWAVLLTAAVASAVASLVTGGAWSVTALF